MPQNMDMTFLKPFVEGTMVTMKVQVGSESKFGKPFLKNRGIPGLTIDIAGTVGIWTEKFKGSITICFPRQTFLKVMGKMLGEEFHEITSELEDGAGELMNIIFGHAKVVLNEQGNDLQKTLPSIIVGENMRLSQMSKQPVIILPFECDLGPFQLEIGLAE